MRKLQHACIIPVNYVCTKTKFAQSCGAQTVEIFDVLEQMVRSRSLFISDTPLLTSNWRCSSICNYSASL